MKLYQEEDLEIIVAGERIVVEGLGVGWVDGEGIVATSRALPNKLLNNPQKIVLPFPFTLEEFKAFCNWHPTFEWEAIQAMFTNDDDTLDEAALSELAARGTDAAELVRLMLTPAETMPVPATANGMTTQEIGAVFDGLPFSQLDWPKRVSSAKWLQGARLSLGIKGGAPSMWCPVKVAQASYAQASKYDQAKRRKDLNSRFKSNPALAPWKDDWDNFHSIFSDTD
jgi:hypothetical protein